MGSFDARSKYNRTIRDIDGDGTGTVDVYSVLVAFNVTCPATAHAIKKLLCAGIRGKGDKQQDLKEAIIAIERAIEINYQSTEESPVDDNEKEE